MALESSSFSLFADSRGLTVFVGNKFLRQRGCRSALETVLIYGEDDVDGDLSLDDLDGGFPIELAPLMLCYFYKFNNETEMETEE